MPPMTPTSIDTTMSNSPFSGVGNGPRSVRSRTQSISSDRPSTISHSLMSPPLSVSPEAAFIAASAASQIVTNDHDSHSETWYDQIGIEPSGETALVSNGALQLANNFVDQLLFNIIAVAGSTSLTALRPAVSEVLKPKLAKDAINQADEELREYLGGGGVEDLDMVHSPSSPSSPNPRDWDLELVWKRTRLRCMVYSSLGDLEEEDEDYFMEQEHLRGESDILTNLVSPAVSIFLTSILEFMGEQVLVISGQAAFNRMRVRYEKELKDGTRSTGDTSERIIVEELDMERVALDRTLGRLWRSWKKRIRSPLEPNHTRSFTRSSSHSRQGSNVDALTGLPSPQETIPEPEGTAVECDGAVREDEKKIIPSAIPLPMSDNDVAEIEVPGLVSYSDDELSDTEEEEDQVAQPPRPKSLTIFPSVTNLDHDTPDLSQPHSLIQASRKRANSLPTPAASPFFLSKSADIPSEPVVQEEISVADDTKRTDEPALAPAPSAVEHEQDDGISPVVPETDVAVENEIEVSPLSPPVSPISNMVSGATAIGIAITTAAVAGVAAMAHGTAPQTIPTPMPTPLEEDEIDEFAEEPEIMTSSRISISGRSSSPSVSDSGRQPSVVPVRSNSVRSVRVIDVQGLRSPTFRSRNGSADFSDFPAARSNSNSNLSREGGVSTPPIFEEVDPNKALAAKTANINAPPASSAERSQQAQTVLAPPAASTAPVTKPVTSASSRTPPPSSATKVTILSSSNPSGSFLHLDDRKPEVPRKSPEHKKEAPLATLPERSAARQNYSQPVPAPVPSSNDRTRTPPSTRGSPESPKSIRTRQNVSPASSPSSKFKAKSSSEDNSSHRAQDVARNFEALLQNDQTIQYTLTPESMRDIDSNRSMDSSSSAVAHKSRKSEDIKSVERSRSSSLQRSISVSKSAGLSSHPLNNQPNEKIPGPVPRAPPVSMTTQARASALTQPRDARVQRDTTADFATFIRSTGPPGDRGQASPVRGSSHVRVPSASNPATMNTSNINKSRQGSVNRARLQARDAAVSTTNESSDLIDFIRRGPPSSSNNPRIPRNIAPFRTTMDSDQLQMSGASGGKAVDATIPNVRNSRASTNVTESSVPSSINSQSALLNKANRPSPQRNNFDDEDMMPKRKQRRVRDPYAIDFSDEEDDFDMTPKPKAKKEESLIDFLNNYEPPADSSPQPFITSQTAPRKKASAPNLMTRLRTGGSATSGSPNGVSTPAGGRIGFNLTETRSPTSSASRGRGYTPITVNIPAGADKFGTLSTNMSSGTATVNKPTGRVPMKKFEPREAVASNATKTSDLAQFLRESEPPPSTIATPPPRAEDKSSGGFARMFERRKKPSVY